MSALPVSVADKVLPLFWREFKLSYVAASHDVITSLVSTRAIIRFAIKQKKVTSGCYEIIG
jgi:hypothetical protein